MTFSTDKQHGEEITVIETKRGLSGAYVQNVSNR